MRSQASMSVICGMVFAPLSSLASAAGREAGDARTFLSQSRISATLGVSIDAGRHIGRNSALCGWGEPNDPDHNGKQVLLTMYRAVGKPSPIERFEYGKTPILGIEKTPVSALGDDAYYIETPGFGVFGFSPEMARTIENSFAQAVLAKL